MSVGPERNDAAQLFSPEKRVPFDSLDAIFTPLDGRPCTSDAYIEGHVLMEWWFNANNNNQRFQLQETRAGSVVQPVPSVLEVIFVSDALERQRFIRKNMRLSLAGGTLNWAGGKEKKRPKLTFTNGIRLQKLDENGKEVIETFDLLPTPPDHRPRDWLVTPAPSSPPAAEVGRPETDAEKKRKRSITPEPAPSTMDFDDIHVDDPADMWTGFPEPDNEEMDVERALSAPSTSSSSTGSGGRATRTASVEMPEAASRILSPDSSKPQVEPPKKKPRMSSSGQRKSQSNLQAINHNSCLDSRSASVASGISVTEGKHHKKNVKRKQKEKEKKALERARKTGAGDGQAVEDVREPSPPPPALPPVQDPAPQDLPLQDPALQDPALDLLPGYKCPESTPAEYLAIADLKKNLQKKVCFVGIVVNKDTPVRVGNQDDWSLGLSLVDSSFGEYSQPFLVNLYAKANEGTRLPVIQVGQPLLLRLIKIVEKPPGKFKGIGYKDSFKWVGYDPLTDATSYGNPPHTDTAAVAGRWQSTRADRKYFKAISAWWNVAGQGIMQGLGIPYSQEDRNTEPPSTFDFPVTQPTELGLVEIKDIPIHDNIPHQAVTVDLVVEVTRCWVHEYASNRVDIFVTDYTLHPKLKLDHQTQHLPYALKISAWDKVGAEASVLIPGYYLFKNVPIKLDKEGYLEGKINDPKENVIQKLSSKHSDLEELLERKQALIDGIVNENSAALDVEELRELDEDQPTTKLVCNEHPAAPFSRIEDVLASTNLPNKFRLAVQIVDYKPRKLREWVRGYCEFCKKEIEEDRERCFDCLDDLDRHLRKFYRFAFKVRNKAGAEMVITAAGNEAQHFLKEIPCDYLNTKEALKSFKDYLKPILPPPEEIDDQQITTPVIDICVAATSSEKYGRTYHLFGCRLMKEGGDAVTKG